MSITVIDTKLPEVKIIKPEVYQDKRGFFYESYNHQSFIKSVDCDVTFVQDNHSKSLINVLRGLHFQLPPFEQGKLIRVIDGQVLDVAVDIRLESPTFGHWVAEILSSDNKKQLWIPPGFAHGFLTKSSTAQLLYKTTNYFSKDHERSIKWNDKDLDIDWGLLDDPIISEKDLHASTLKNFIKNYNK